MKRLVSLFLILFSIFNISAENRLDFVNLNLDLFQKKDTVDLFNDMTDIERLIQQKAEADTIIQSTSDQTNGRHNNNQDIKTPSNKSQKVKLNIIRPKIKGLSEFKSSFDSLAVSGLSFRDTMFYSPLYLPMIFNGKILPADLSLLPKQNNPDKGVLIPTEQTFEPLIGKYDFVNKVRHFYYHNFPDHVKFSLFNAKNKIEDLQDNNSSESVSSIIDRISTQVDFSLEAPTVDRVLVTRKYWVLNGQHSLQASHNFFSDNWYKGGSSYYNINSNQTFWLNYNKNKIHFANSLECKFSVFSSTQDTIHQFRIADDRLRLYSIFSIDAFFKKWSYSFDIDAKTQIWNQYPENSKKLVSTFLAPLMVNSGIGLKYELDKKSKNVRHRRIRVKAAIHPLSLSYVYVNNDHVNVKRFGIEEGRNNKLEYGSTVTFEMDFNFNKYILLNTKFKYFSNYHNVESEMENTLDMALNNYLSTRLSLNLRYFDNVPPDPKFKHIQVNEKISFGLSYRW